MDYGRFKRAFEHEVEGKVRSERDKLYYLEQYTTGEVNNLVKSYLAMDPGKGFRQAKQALIDKYGNPFRLADAYITSLKDFPEIKAEDKDSLSRYSLLLIECKNSISSLDHLQELNHTSSIQTLTLKLPYRMRDKWRTKTDLIQETRRVQFDDFVLFVEKQSRILSNPTFGNIKDEKVSQRKPPHRPKGAYAAVEVQRDCLYCSKGAHRIEECRKFDNLQRPEKLTYIKEHRLCYGCLTTGHLAKHCNSRHTCTKCKRRHPTTLHQDPVVNTETTNKNNDKQPNQLQAACAKINQGECALAVIPVRVSVGCSHQVETYAFLDPGSTISFCSEALVKQLGVGGRNECITIDTMGSTYRLTTKAVKGLKVTSLDNRNMETVIHTAYTKSNLPIQKAHFPKQSDIDKWPHLQGVQIPQIDKGKEVGLLIGMGVASAYTPLEVKTGPIDAPHATRTNLRWIVWNLIGNHESSHPYPANIVGRNVEKSTYDTLEKLVKRSTEIDFPESGLDLTQNHSVEDKLFLRKLNESIVKGPDNHFTISLPFRRNEVVMPDNRLQAVKRLESLCRRLKADKPYAMEYINYMDELLTKGYAERVPPDEIIQDGHKWYIPHHGVYNPQKPGKLRVVFVCGARYQGVALNDVLLPGPNLTSNLLGVLLRFREEEVAIIADVEKMF
ncbi:uncharacterized protein [Antedon mediterranea]|uniref:uncharacterized protein n=1 Tax=Antedon mediterranea TaxID=105859 RepID=UPI003AF4CCC8